MPVTKATGLGKRQRDHSDKEISKVWLSRGKKKGKGLGLRKILKELREQYFPSLQSWCSQIASYEEKTHSFHSICYSYIDFYLRNSLAFEVLEYS